MRNPGYGDFLAWWFGSRVLFTGGNPYTTPPDVAPFFIVEPLYYPATALVVSGPFGPLPYFAALAAFFGIGTALLGWAIARKAPHLLAIFCSFPFIMAAQLGHWAPWLAAAFLLPALGFLVAVKPNIGMALLASRASRPMFIGATMLVALSLIIAPRWPSWWLGTVAGAPRHLVPIATWYGVPLLLAALRWRTSEGRLLLAMSVLPQTATFADQLLIGLVARTQRQALVLAGLSVIGGLAWIVRVRSGGHAPTVGAPYVVLSIYLPALIIVLRHRNSGTLPAWLERSIAGLPSWIRGDSPALTK